MSIMTVVVAEHRRRAERGKTLVLLGRGSPYDDDVTIHHPPRLRTDGHMDVRLEESVSGLSVSFARRGRKITTRRRIERESIYLLSRERISYRDRVFFRALSFLAHRLLRYPPRSLSDAPRCHRPRTIRSGPAAGPRRRTRSWGNWWRSTARGSGPVYLNCTVTAGRGSNAENAG